MLKLIKYEFLKTKALLLFSLAALLLLQLVIVVGHLIKQVDNDNVSKIGKYVYQTGSMFFVIALFGSIFALLIYSIILYAPDITRKQGYTVFLTPNSCYKIIGSKLITTFIVMIAGSIVIFLLAVLNYKLFINNLSDNNDPFSQIFVGLDKEVTSDLVLTLVIFVLSTLLKWFANIILIYFSITLVYTYLTNASLKGLIAFLAYMLFSGVIGAISAIPAFALSTPQASDMQGLEALSQYNSIYVITIVINLVLGVVLYFATAAMAEKKLSM